MGRWNSACRRRCTVTSLAGRHRSACGAALAASAAFRRHARPRRRRRAISGLRVPSDHRAVVPRLRPHPWHVPVAARPHRRRARLQHLHADRAGRDLAVWVVAPCVVGCADPRASANRPLLASPAALVIAYGVLRNIAVDPLRSLALIHARATDAGEPSVGCEPSWRTQRSQPRSGAIPLPGAHIAPTPDWGDSARPKLRS